MQRNHTSKDWASRSGKAWNGLAQSCGLPPVAVHGIATGCPGMTPAGKEVLSTV
jgi:uncharacterized protein (UPF0276 family)